MSITLYGIPNCSTVKKARLWLEENGVDYTFYDIKKQGLDAQTLQNWLQDVAADVLINRKGTTWRKIPDEQKTDINSDEAAIALMLAWSSVIKRPVLTGTDSVYVGFSADSYQQIFRK